MSNKSKYKLVETVYGRQEKIPEDWEIKKFREFVSVKNGFAFESKDFVDVNGIKVVKIGDIQKDGQVNTKNLDKVIVKNIENFKGFELNDNDILMALTGATLGKCGIVKTKEILLQNQRVGRIFPTDNKYLDEKFLFFMLTSSFIQNQIWSLVSTSAQPNIGKPELDKIKFFKPNELLEQQKIGKILSNVNELSANCDLRIEVIKKLKNYLIRKLSIEGINHKQFKKVTLYPRFLSETIPKDWEIKPMSEIAEIIMGQSPPGESYNETEGIPLLNGPTEFGLAHPIPIQYTNKPTKLCEENDILLCVRGSTTGRLNLSDQQYCIGRGLAAIRGKKNLTDTKWLFFQFTRLKELISNIASGGGTTFPNINQDFIKKIILPFPKIEEQQKITHILNSIESRTFDLEFKKNNLEQIKKGLMQKLLTGAVRVKI